MIKKMVGEMTGLSDIGRILTKEEYVHAQADDYIFHEDNEIIHYVIKSAKDEYCFTNLAIIHVDGESATSSKRIVRRYAYKNFSIYNVLLESAGKLDRDCEIKFKIKKAGTNPIEFSIDVEKQQLEQLKDLYKALISINMLQNNSYREYDAKKEAIDETLALFKIHRQDNLNSVTLEDIIDMLANKKLAAFNDTNIVDFGHVFVKYIEN